MLITPSEAVKAAAVQRWAKSVIETYPEDTARFLGSEKDRFANPVGSTVLRELPVLFEELTDQMRPARVEAALGNIIRIRAVQDFSPQAAIGFVFKLRPILRQEWPELESSDLEQLDSRIDLLALQAFDIYLKCREKIYDLRVKEMMAQREMALNILASSNAGTEGEPL